MVNSGAATAIHTELAALRPQLLRFARLQLRDESAAEDVVQEALLAAVQGAERFAGGARLKTWVISILRNKIIDELRRRMRDPAEPLDVDDDDTDLDALFAADGHWAERQAGWGDPQATLEQKRFLEMFEICLEGMAPNPGRVFMMREVLGFETEEICKAVGISTSNCWVLLHRARMVLRECLKHRWFGQERPC